MGLIGEWQALRRLLKTPKPERTILFYSEGPDYWVHFQAVIGHLTETLGRTVCYVSSSAGDPGLTQDHPRILPFNIGGGLVRTIFFKTLDSGLMVMTLTDFGNLYLKRSSLPVHFAYIFHSPVSTHMIYRNRAFEHYDSILCCGPHHMAEIRETEALYGLPQCPLYEHGYGRLDSLVAAGAALQPPGSSGPANGPKRILVAPSWGPRGLFEGGHGEALVQALLEAGFHVTVRPHPQTLKLNRDCWTRLVARFGGEAGFVHEEDVSTEESLLAADLMVSDWSGAALEYSFGLERPVLFIDVPRKVNNPEYERLQNVPLEVSIRDQIGVVLSPGRMAEAPGLVTDMLDRAGEYAGRARECREKWMFNVGHSGRRGAEILVELAESHDHTDAGTAGGTKGTP